jgi:cytidylate kinase
MILGFSMTQTPIPVITVDGPSGAGKGTLTQLLAKKLGWHLLDSGALYRLTAASAEKNKVALDDESGLAKLAENLDVAFLPSAYGEPVKVLLAGEDVTLQIRTETCGNAASTIAPLQGVRAALLNRQRAFRQPAGLVADGRDMGTVVFPDAPLKIYLTASAEVRAQRRFDQLKDKVEGVKICALLKEIKERDERDTGRKNAPLKPADDAILLDSSSMSIDEVLTAVLNEAANKGLV